MNLCAQFRLTTELLIERFKNLPPSVRSHTIIIWDGDEAFFWCEKHNKYFEENEQCPQCKSEQELGAKTEPEFKRASERFAPRFLESLRRRISRLVSRQPTP